jgi:hypothetical protein
VRDHGEELIGFKGFLYLHFFSPPRGQFLILQRRQGRTLVLAIGPPRAGLDTLTEVF